MKQLCLLFSYCILVTYANCQEVRFRKITSNQGLSHNTVYAITQDQNGFMWFGTREGLNRYDSYNIKNYYVSSSEIGGSANRINALTSYKSTVYVGTENGLYIYNSEIDQLQKSEIFPNRIPVLCLLTQGEDVFVATTHGLYKITKNRATLISDRKRISAMAAIDNYTFLVAIGNSLITIDQNGKKRKIFETNSLGKIAESGLIFNITKDTNGKIWLATSNGLFNYNNDNQRFTELKFATTTTTENKTVRAVSGNRKNLYICTEEGLYIYDFKLGTSKNYQQSFTSDPKKLNDKAIYSIYSTKDGAVWMGTYFGGVNYISPNTFGFNTIMANDKGNGLSGKAVSQMMEDNQHCIWIGTEDGGITIFNPLTDTYSFINKTSSPYRLTTNNVHAIHDDGYGNIWVGTFLGGLHQFDTKQNRTTVYSNHKGDPTSISNDQVYAIYRDSSGKLWIATQSGLNNFNYQTKTFSLFKPTIMGDMFVYDIIEDKNNELWFCTRQNGIFRYHPKTDKLIHYTANDKNTSLQSNQIISVYKDSKQQLWFGTLDGGLSLYNPDTNTFSNYTIANGLLNNNVYGILEDDKGIIWLTTNRGISKLDTKTKKIINYDTKYGLPTNQFNFKSYLKSSDGTLYFGSINGLCYFNPLTIATHQTALPIVFTDFQLFNKSVVPGSSSILKQQINYSDKIELSYDQNVFTINFAAINFANPGSTSYAYYLKGFENKWNDVGVKNSVTYTNLSPGNYVFILKAVNANGSSISRKRTLKIHVAPPFYLSFFAYVIYFLLVGLMVWLYTRFVKFIQYKKLEIQLERVEKEKIKELTQHRLNFFTFISHEFKTPLTLILASIDKFLEDKGSEFKKSSELANVKTNASILFKLIQQLMEFRKIETDHESINLAQSNVVDFVKNATFSFEAMTAKKGVDLRFSAHKPSLDCCFDHDKLEKILFNIISNAVKNTEVGYIEVLLQEEEEHEASKLIVIKVIDTGRGMNAIELENIFNPFYNSATEQYKQQSSGIGLALVDSLVKYLNGKINVKSKPLQGTVIEIKFPVLTEQTKNTDTQTILAEEENNPVQLSEDNTATKYTLMVVEDNKELLTFLSKHFSKTYQVTTASNGLIALKKITKTPPDIIISDVKMPKMDGIELCKRLKEDPKFNYIPFILLSDSNKEKIKIDGLDVGADAYIAKPFNLKEFELLIANMIKSRVKLREHVIGMGSFMADKMPSNNKDQEFLAKLSKLLENQFSNPTISIEEIASELNTSRTSLHLNLKRILGKNATELLNEFRLKKALIMLENDMPINEIAYHCGYGDPNYFSRVFKKTYLETPINYKKRYMEGKIEF